MLELRIASLEPGVHTFTLSPAPDDLDLDGELFSDITVEARVDLGEHQAFVSLHTEATASLVCDRTMAPFEQQIEGTHDVLFTSAALDIEQEGEEPDDDLLPLAANQTVLDVTAPARDTIMLSLPTRRVAPGADDEDLPTSFGALTSEDGSAVDSRWEALLKLKNQDS